MTCIAAFVEGDTVWMGGDSAGVAGLSLSGRDDQKVFRNGPMVFGFTTSFRMGQLLRYALTVPDHDPRVDIDKYMATTFIDAVRACLKDHGWASKRNDSEEGGCFLVGYKGRLFRIDDDYQVGVPADGFDAVGCGHDIAKGALYATPEMSGRARLVLALSAAERHSAGVRGPFHVESLRTEATTPPPPPAFPPNRVIREGEVPAAGDL